MTDDALKALRAEFEQKLKAAEAQVEASAAQAAAALQQKAAAEEKEAVAVAQAEAALQQKATAEEKEAVALAKAEAAFKGTFVAKLEGMSGSASESNASGGGSDVARRGAPAPVEAPVDEVLSALQPDQRLPLGVLWNKFKELVASLPQPLLHENVREVVHVHPVVKAAFDAALQRGCKLRIWHDIITADSIPVQEMKPDFVVTHERDAQPSVIGALLLGEVKLPDDLETAVAQACNMGRRRMLRLFREADRRGDDLHSITVLVVATDGYDLRFLRIRSGAPPAGSSYENAVPCLCHMTPALPLLLRTSDGAEVPDVCPSGFAALVRVLSAGPAALCCFGQPLSSVHAALPASSAADGAVTWPQHLQLAQRLGSGGFSDVYSFATSQELPRSAAAGAVLKLPRWTSEKQQLHFEREACVLRLLAEAAVSGVPRLLCEGVRLSPARMPWPLLVLAPVGCSLADTLRERQKLQATASAARLEQRAFADAVLAQVQATLRAAHGADVIHCDVRPQNCVIAPDGTACLLDWGLSCASSTNIHKVGVPQYTVSAVYTSSTYTATARLDLAAAALLWACVAHGDACAAPWSERCAPELAAGKREKWLDARAARNDSLRAVRDRVRDLERPRAVVAADYQWMPAAPAEAGAARKVV
jgi:hypothetical protein